MNGKNKQNLYFVKIATYDQSASEYKQRHKINRTNKCAWELRDIVHNYK